MVWGNVVPSMTDPRHRSDWRWWRMEAIIRDDYECQECGALGGRRGDTRLHVHHKTAVADGGENNLENLVTLCSMCHVGHPGRLITASGPAGDTGDTPCLFEGCDRSFDGEEGMMSHYATSHGEPYPWRDYVTLVCDQCGVEFERREEKAEDARFCTKACSCQFQKELYQ